MKKRKGNQTVQDLEKTLRRRGGKIKTIYEKRNDAEINKMIEDKINYIWDYINRIDDVVNEDEMLEEEIKQKKKKKKSLKRLDNYDEIIYYNKNMNNLVNIQKIRKTLHHFNIYVNLEDIVYMFIYFTNNKYFSDVMENKLYFCDYIDKKKNENKFRSININDLYINYEMFKHIFLNIDLNIESNGQVW
ncbi:conserved Plasmodium protein, unknown function [Plasmodium ovale wallikeri]|uniref:Uncharacterized protein n=1 Tax=Plasmodium ovale wallikeri TaxID=864142 RepID=A0A1A8YU80_PLAOA|nr:conserved Plasmodium protein, unknown function [Plasmodium ovale wallikeri]SBT35424.1 conserved Plasmodium protein, unknown function [Plasmodium ovale wallikeri]